MTKHTPEPTDADIATDWNLWAEYVDPGGTMTKGEFSAMPIQEKLYLMEDCFGPETWRLSEDEEGRNG